VLAAANYPGTPRTGDLISGYRRTARTAMSSMPAPAKSDGRIVTAGGRVLCVTTLSDNVKQAQKRAYDLIVGIHFDGMQYRRDIGHRAISR
jgi:phosphoribosylamine--glycine ligase